MINTRATNSWRAVGAGVACVLMLGVGRVAAQAVDVPVQPDAVVTAESAMISLNFPDNLEVKVLADYVAARLGINIFYDEAIGGKRVTLRTPAQVSRDSLLGLLESALKMKGLALVDAEQPGWKRIVTANDLLRVVPAGLGEPAVGGAIGDDVSPTRAITRIFQLRHSDTRYVEQTIKPFLTPLGANTLSLPERGMVIVTDYASSLQRVAELIRLLDQPRTGAAFEFVTVEHMDAAELARQVAQLLASERKAIGGGNEGLDVTADARLNRLAIVGLPERVREVAKLARSLDVPLKVQTRRYQFHTASAERVDRLVKELMDPHEVRRAYRSAIDRDAGWLVVTAPAAVHERIEQLRVELDQPATQQQSRVRIYKLQHAKAADVLATIQSLEGDNALRDLNTDSLAEPSAGPASPAAPLSPPASPAADAVSSDTVGSSAPPLAPSQEPAPGQSADVRSSSAPTPPPAGSASTSAPQATVSADANTNSIIVIADPEIQAVYAKLIEALDRRRPQVLVEVTIVTIDTTDNTSLGVEIVSDESAGGTRYLNFTSFGLSEFDPDTSLLTLTPGVGFNGAVLSSDIADVVIRALRTNNRSRVSSRPQVLVNDNATGQISAVSEQPYNSVNASDTVATTSFAGFVEAGTTIKVTPHISEGDYLALEYSVTLNSFTGEATSSGGAVLPPPRQTNSVESQVTVPNGHTIVVGGLSVKNDSNTKRSVPFLGDIPLLEYLFSSRTRGEVQNTLFVFIRPVILRDDQFNDLKFLSERDTGAAGLDPTYPASGPMAIR